MALEAPQPSAHLSAMSAALKMPPHMTVAEFLDWEPDDRWGDRWQLRNGEPEVLAPNSDSHGSIQAQLAYLLVSHLDGHGGPCRVVMFPGVVPAERADENCLVPDLGITCTPPTGAHLMEQPLVLIEILSPTNISKTRANVRAYRTIPTVVEIVVVHSTVIAAEILRRAPDGAWPHEAAFVGADDELRLDSIGFATPLRAAYRTTGLT